MDLCRWLELNQIRMHSAATGLCNPSPFVKLTHQKGSQPPYTIKPCSTILSIGLIFPNTLFLHFRATAAESFKPLTFPVLRSEGQGPWFFYSRKSRLPSYPAWMKCWPLGTFLVISSRSLRQCVGPMWSEMWAKTIKKDYIRPGQPSWWWKGWFREKTVPQKHNLVLDKVLAIWPQANHFYSRSLNFFL